MPKVCIDPGHGGRDPGAVGNNLRESDINLAIALKAKTLLEANGIDVTMTRSSDVGLAYSMADDLQARCNVANSAQANLYVSIHVNSGGGAGAETHIYGRGGQAERAAAKIHYYLVDAGRWSDRGIKVSNFQVLRNTSMPAVLTENGFIDNSSDAAKLSRLDFIDDLALAHTKGICEYFGVEYRDPVVIAQEPPSAAQDRDAIKAQIIKLLEVL